MEIEKQNTALKVALTIVSVLLAAAIAGIGVLLWKYVWKSDAADEAGLSERAIDLFMSIPDHDEVQPEAAALMTDDLYSALQSAWELPQWAEGEIGDEEFLYYFTTGNGGGSYTRDDVSVESINVTGDGEATVSITYTLREDEYVWDGNQKTLYLVQEDGEWLLDDFSLIENGRAKQACEDYVQSQVSACLAGDINRSILEENDNPDIDYNPERATKAWGKISSVQDQFIAYFSQYEIDGYTPENFSKYNGRSSVQTYSNTRFGFTATYPSCMTVQMPPENGDGASYQWGPDIVYTVSAMLNATNTAPEDEVKPDDENDNITIAKVEGDSYVKSGRYNGKMYYEKGILSNGNWYHRHVEYPSSYKSVMEDFITTYIDPFSKSDIPDDSEYTSE